MSVYNHFLLQNTPQGNTINPGVLFEAGPIINIEISIPKALADVYSQTGQTIPQPKIGIALIDTGAKKSCVHDSIMQDLGVSTIGQVMSGTANGQRPCKLFPAFFNFPGTGISVDFTSVVEVKSTDIPVPGKLKKAGNNLHGLCPLAVPDITCPIVLTPRSCIIESCTQLFLAPVSIKAIPIFGCGIVCPV